MKTYLFRPLVLIADCYLQLLLKLEYRHQKNEMFNERAVEYAFVFRHLAKYTPRNVLDVGTGQSALPALIRNCGIHTTAVDNIRDFWPKGFINRHFYVINDNIKSPSLRKSYDMITCISVLEHIREHRQAVRSMFKLLKDKGRLILTFPYNENRYSRNVYESAGSNAPGNLPYITQAFSRKEVEEWIADNNAGLVAQEYWRYFSGEYWTVGNRLPAPQKVRKDEKHQITCILLKKMTP